MLWCWLTPGRIRGSNQCFWLHEPKTVPWSCADLKRMFYLFSVHESWQCDLQMM